MSNIKHAVISAAGLGSRLELNMPKCLVEVGGRSIIDYQLDLLADIEDVRIVVGFMESAVIDHVRQIRDDVLFVRNPDYRKTSNSYSLNLGTHDLVEPFLSVDGDVIIKPESFRNFVAQCDGSRSIIGVTPSKTEEAVFTHLSDDLKMLHSFDFENKAPYEWSGIAYLKDVKIERNAGFVCHEIGKHLPLSAQIIECHEIDTPEDLNHALEVIDQYRA